MHRMQTVGPQLEVSHEKAGSGLPRYRTSPSQNGSPRDKSRRWKPFRCIGVSISTSCWVRLLSSPPRPARVNRRIKIERCYSTPISQNISRALLSTRIIQQRDKAYSAAWQLSPDLTQGLLDAHPAANHLLLLPDSSPPYCRLPGQLCCPPVSCRLLSALRASNQRMSQIRIHVPL